MLPTSLTSKLKESITSSLPPVPFTLESWFNRKSSLSIQSYLCVSVPRTMLYILNLVIELDREWRASIIVGGSIATNTLATPSVFHRRPRWSRCRLPPFIATISRAQLWRRIPEWEEFWSWWLQARNHWSDSSACWTSLLPLGACTIIFRSSSPTLFPFCTRGFLHWLTWRYFHTIACYVIRSFWRSLRWRPFSLKSAAWWTLSTLYALFASHKL